MSTQSRGHATQYEPCLFSQDFKPYTDGAVAFAAPPPLRPAAVGALFQRVAISDCHRLVIERLSVNGQAVRRAGFVLAAIAPPDGARVVEENVEIAL